MRNITAAMSHVIATAFVNRLLSTRLIALLAILFGLAISSFLGRRVTTSITRPERLDRSRLLVLARLVAAIARLTLAIGLPVSLLALGFALTWLVATRLAIIAIGVNIITAIVILWLIGTSWRRLVPVGLFLLFLLLFIIEAIDGILVQQVAKG